MNLSFEDLQFHGKIIIVAEEELGFSFAEDPNNRLVDQIYREYIDAGRPRNAKAWIRERLSRVFLSLTEAPRWIEKRPMWPFENGRPMVFVKQFSIPQEGLAESLASPGAEVYIFCARVPQDHQTWRMTYRVIEQHPGV